MADFVLKLSDVIVGRSRLERRDGTRRTASGTFRPGLGYELVEPIFALRDAPDGAARYTKARDALNVMLYAPDGTLVETTRLDIVRHGAGLVLECGIVDAAFFGVA